MLKRVIRPSLWDPPSASSPNCEGPFYRWLARVGVKSHPILLLGMEPEPLWY